MPKQCASAISPCSELLNTVVYGRYKSPVTPSRYPDRNILNYEVGGNAPFACTSTIPGRASVIHLATSRSPLVHHAHIVCRVC